MRLILFDIDGTLLLTGNVGQSSARISLERIFGTSGRIDEFYPGGRTIDGIFQDTLIDAGFSEESYLSKRSELYADFLAEFQHRIENGKHDIKALPGALQLVDALSQSAQVILGLVTGNHQDTARAKLEYAGFDYSYFKVGAYGHESTDRTILVPLAKKRSSSLTGQPLDGRHTVVIGDTTRDVLGAKAAGARSIAVATGTDHLEMLQQVQPDFLFSDFNDYQAVIAAIMQP